MSAPDDLSDHLGGLMPDMPSSTEVIRAMADHYYELAHQLDAVANHQALLDTDPQYAQRVQEAEDQVVGDELLMEMQRTHATATVTRVVKHTPIFEQTPSDGVDAATSPGSPGEESADERR